MTSKKKIKKIAKTMFKFSFRDQYLDETKIRSAVSLIDKSKIQSASKILKLYKRLIQAQVAKEKVIIEAPAKISPKLEKVIILKSKAKKLEFKLNPEMAFGAKITHGDWIWDTSLESKLKRLTINDQL